MVYQCNPFSPTQGGGVRYVVNLLESLPEEVSEILFLGIGEKSETRGRVKFLPLGKKDFGYPFFAIQLFYYLLLNKISNFHAVHTHRLYFAIPFLLLAPKIPVVCTLHGRTFEVFRSRYGSGWLNIVKPFFELLEKFAISRVKKIVAVSSDVLKSFESKYPKLIERKAKDTVVIGSGLDLTSFSIGQSTLLQKSYGSDKRFLLGVGRLEHVKNFEFLLDLLSKKFSEERDVILVLAGEGSQRESLQEQVRKKRLEERVVFLGQVSPDKMPTLMQSADLLLVSSHHEGSPTIIKEALATGLPVVTTDVGDVRDFIVDGANGYVVSAELEAYSNAVQKALAFEDGRPQIKEVSEEVLLANSLSSLGKRYAVQYSLVKRE